MNSTLSDLKTQQDINAFIDSFYQKLLADDELAPIFIDIAEIDLIAHLPLIKSYWAKLLLGDKTYNRHTMNIHRGVNSKQNLTIENFTKWLEFFDTTMDSMFCDKTADKAKRIAATIASNMIKALI